MALKLQHDILEGAHEKGDIWRWITNATALLNELQATIGLVRTAVGDGVLAIGTLAIHSTPEQFATTTAAYYRMSGIQYSKAITGALAFTAAHPVTASKFGAILVQINAAGTVTTRISGATQTTTQAYNSGALAIAALPSPQAGNVALGYIVIEADSGGWTAITDDLTDASDLTTATFVDATALPAFLTTVAALTESTPLTLAKG